jgi:glucose-1-phosphate thymidylyltransferase
MKEKNNNRKGIILAGGTGSRLFPITKGINKHLIPLYDKPMIYYPLSILMLLGIKDILIITTKNSLENYNTLLSNGNHLGINLEYKIQEEPKGIAQALLLAEEFIENNNFALILGDNFFYGERLIDIIKISNTNKGATVFAYPVKNPKNYGVIEFDKDYKVLNITEKPKVPKSRYAITGLYFFDNNIFSLCKNVKPSKRGELEITSILDIYFKKNNLNVQVFGRGITWLDTGTIDDLHEASSFIRTLEHRQGLKIACVEEVAWRNGWIDTNKLIRLAEPLKEISYGKYLISLIEDNY